MAKRHVVPKDYLSTIDALLDVLQRQCAPQTEINVQGQMVPVSALAAEVAGYRTPFDEVRQDEIRLEHAYQRRDASIATGKARMAMIKAGVTAFLGAVHPALDRPGLRRPGGAHKLTPEQEIARHAKAKETMKLQGRLTQAQKKEKTYRGPVNVKVVLKKDE